VKEFISSTNTAYPTAITMVLILFFVIKKLTFQAGILKVKITMMIVKFCQITVPKLSLGTLNSLM